MKTHSVIIALLVVLLLLILFKSKASNPAYIKKMHETMSSMKEAKSAAEYIETANSFARIASVSENEWLPKYYQAKIYIDLIHNDKNASDEQKEKYIDIARMLVDELLLSHPREVEVQVLDGWCWINKIGIRPMVYGMIYIGKYNAAIERAYAIEAKNPRAIFLDLSNKIGKAEFFNSDISEFCLDVKALYANWDNYLPKSEMHPVWGKDGLNYQLSKCQ